MNITKRSLLTLSCMAALLATGSAQADLVLTLTSGTSSVTIHDGGVGDANGAAGAIGFIGTVGNFQLNFAGLPNDYGIVNGVSSHDPATLWLTSLIATSKGAGTLTIQLYDDGFSYAPGAYTATTSVTGFTNGSVNFSSQFNNLPSGPGGITSSFASTGPTFNNIQSTGVVDTTGGFSLTQIATITHTATGRQVTSFDMITTVPEPATLGLLGIGLVGLAFVRRKKEGK